MALGAARNRPTVRGSGAFGNEAYVRVPIPQGRSTGGNSPTTTMAVGWELTSLRLEIGSGPLTGPAGQYYHAGAPQRHHCRHRRSQGHLEPEFRRGPLEDPAVRP
jgi:hypothetical protein